MKKENGEKIMMDDDELDRVNGGFQVHAQGGEVDLHEGPGISSAVVMTLPEGTLFDATGCTKLVDGMLWAEVRPATGGEPAWIEGRHIGL